MLIDKECMILCFTGIIENVCPLGYLLDNTSEFFLLLLKVNLELLGNGESIT